MSFIDDLTQKLTQTGQSAIQKTKGYAETVKINSRVSEEERKLNGIYQQIGKLYCSTHSESCEPEFSELLADVASAEKNIAELREQAQAVKNTGVAKCANCGSALTPDMKFCAVCGTPAAAKNTEPPESEFGVRHCPTCGAQAQDNDLFCAECGTRL